MGAPWFALFEVCDLLHPNRDIKLTAGQGLGRRKGTSTIFPYFHAALATDALKLIRSPAFNRAVQKAYRKINRLPDFEQKNGGGRTGPSSLDHFRDEVKHQFRELTWQKRPPK
ncbi:hypothetical protein BKA58DRAFT_456689 [Alternaria rosae]|uniref:uncharacterized protein n=1 Tax=Alternaria rosae TaxID=1187941 RepID=UPI001E8EAEB9|nr:uncharacterized protein BKA58DRAFT_456689 [Alternaria rosae]KAH6873059.1 hypothetical protein BKA58DRAFT_456689 [Alternaria rosae]